MTAKPLPRRDLLCYGALALPLAFAGMPLYVHAPDFYATEVGLSLSLIGISLLLLRLIDAVQDPLLGQLSDRFAAHRYVIMLAAAGIMVGGFAALFHPLAAAPLLWFFASMLLATLGFSLLGINLNTLGALWSEDAHQKTRITAMREALGLVGLLIAVMLPSVLQQTLPAEHAFNRMSALLAILTLAALLAFHNWQKRNLLAIRAAQTARPDKVWTTLKALSPSTRRFFAIYGLSMLASSMPGILILFFVRDRLQAEILTGLFLALYFLAGAAGLPLWQWLSRRHGKLRIWALAMLMAVLCFIWAGLLGAGDTWQFGIICVLSGVAFGADLALPPSVLADEIQAAGARANASFQFGLMTFLLKFALALASALAFPALELAGFVPGEANDKTALYALSAAYAFVPCLIKALAAWLLWRSLPLFHNSDGMGGRVRAERHATNKGDSYASTLSSQRNAAHA